MGRRAIFELACSPLYRLLVSGWLTTILSMTELSAEPLLAWYADHHRQLPWRAVRDPYAIWVSEVMLQQTQVETVIPYYERWMAAFPTVAALAGAPIDNVLKLWEGLGYYRRAHALHRAAGVLVATTGGRLPRDVRSLEALPGIGPYTARAIASMAFGADELALDGNLKRVLSRLFNIELPVNTPDGERLLRAQGLSILPAGHASEFNQALMDLGALICRRGVPDCPACPLQDSCQAHQAGEEAERPVRASRPDRRHHIRVSAVLRRGKCVLVGKRPEGKLLGGLWEFPGGKLEPGERLDEALRREMVEELDLDVTVGKPIGVYEHAYTHYSVTAHALECGLPANARPKSNAHSELRWVTPAGLADLPMGKIDRAIAADVAGGSAETTAG